MRTIETGKAVVEIIAWPEGKPWEARYQTISRIENGICTLTLSNEVFHNAAKANTAYRRFARKIRESGQEPPDLTFHNMKTKASESVFCVLSVSRSVFNSACRVGSLCILESGIDDRRRMMAILKN